MNSSQPPEPARSQAPPAEPNPDSHPGTGRGPGTDCQLEPELPPGIQHLEPVQVPLPGTAGRAVASLVLAIVAPASLLVTGPFASFAMLLTFPYNGPSENPWLAPAALWSLPMVFGLISVFLALSALRKPGLYSEGRGLAVASLWISGVVFVVGLIFTVRFIYLMQLG